MMKYFFGPLLLTALLMACQQTPSNMTNQPTTNQATRPGEPDWAKNAILYECNVRQFSPEGTLNGVRKQLPRLKDLGITVLWLMPIHPIGVEKRKEKAGDLGSPYSVKDYYAINPDFGTLDDLKSLVQEAHALGLKVILDWVPNHTAWDAVWMKEHPEYYTRVNGQFTVPLNENGGSTGWDDVVDLDYGNPALRKAMIEVMQYWIKTADIDGYRVDMAGLVPNDFWAEARPALDAVKQVFMLSEWQDEPGHFNSCFNANYGWKWKDVTKDIGAGKQNALALDTLMNFLNGFYPSDYYQMYFTQNHDENTWNGTETDLYGASADAFNVLAFTWQGVPMLYNGQEDGLSQRLAFFAKDPVKWKDYGRSAFFQKLCALKKNPALHAGKNGGTLRKIKTTHDDRIYAFYREKEANHVIVVLNLSKSPQSVKLDLPDSLIGGAYQNVFGESTVELTKDMMLNLKPWEYLVLTLNR